jgi:hypothetical protein
METEMQCRIGGCRCPKYRESKDRPGEGLCVCDHQVAEHQDSTFVIKPLNDPGRPLHVFDMGPLFALARDIIDREESTAGMVTGQDAVKLARSLLEVLQKR